MASCPLLITGLRILLGMIKSIYSKCLSPWQRGNTLVGGYPEQLEWELRSLSGISLEVVDLAFTCPGSSGLYVTLGLRLWSQSPGDMAGLFLAQWGSRWDPVFGRSPLAPSHILPVVPACTFIHRLKCTAYSRIDRLSAAKSLLLPQKVSIPLGCRQKEALMGISQPSSSISS
jgi:hemopexin